MIFYNVFHVGHAAVAYLERISVENAVQFRSPGEVLVYQLQEYATDVCCDTLAERGVKPYDVPPSVLPPRSLLHVY